MDLPSREYLGKHTAQTLRCSSVLLEGRPKTRYHASHIKSPAAFISTLSVTPLRGSSVRLLRVLQERYLHEDTRSVSMFRHVVPQIPITKHLFRDIERRFSINKRVCCSTSIWVNAKYRTILKSFAAREAPFTRSIARIRNHEIHASVNTKMTRDYPFCFA